MVYLCSEWTLNVHIKYFMFDWSIYRLFVLNSGWKRDSLQLMIFVNVYSTRSIVELKTRFETCITRNDVNGVRWFHLSYIITLKDYLCAQMTSNVQIKYFKFDWSIYRLFVLNTAWKRDSLQMIIFVIFCSTWSMVQLKTRFESCITRNCVNGLRLFRASYLITLMVYLCSQWTPNVQIKYFMSDWSIYRLFVLIRGWKLESFQIMLIACLLEI
jgi:hypothetical protein